MAKTKKELREHIVRLNTQIEKKNILIEKLRSVGRGKRGQTSAPEEQEKV